MMILLIIDYFTHNMLQYDICSIIYNSTGCFFGAGQPLSIFLQENPPPCHCFNVRTECSKKYITTNTGFPSRLHIF
jgi:hypothetical protein